MGSILRAYSNLLSKFPTTMQCLQAGTLMGVGDASSQFFVEGKSFDEYEWRRTARFFAIGTFFVGPVLTKWYGLLDCKFGSGKGISAVKKVASDQLIFAPSFLGAFLSVLGITQGHSVAQIQQEIKTNYKDIILTNWSVWPAVQIINFSFVSLHHQVLVVQTFAVFWNTYLAWKTNRSQ
ncbi:protein Mpv17-like isoform X1 [Portunus trituberculatus]|uniref:protein Mpv17-like isoform X1 n=2 Tax=Portunus trituberculatus TaxID=210409 RepID=UPI001E1CEBC8|nr:protein Mpv17-like isoform X1 [Portunus trituberculatus]XP_045104111.1 protein Mpv17-like isoform X1 [Portunus trituberculatus]XP_045104112.1 protein Mpv17-like isoform X1 [Portunus trituberculatus]